MHIDTPRKPNPRQDWRYRTNVGARTLAGTIGAYAASALLGMALARILPMPRIDAVIVGSLAALLAIPAVTIWAFLARSAWIAWAGVIALALLCGAIVWLTGKPA